VARDVGNAALDAAPVFCWIGADDLDLYRQRNDGHVRVPVEERGRAIAAPYHDMFRVQRMASDERPALFISWMLGAKGHYFSCS